MAREVVVGPDGLARGVSYIDKKTRSEVPSTPRWWCWPPVAARRRAFCSIPKAASFRMAWRTPADWWGVTSWTPWDRTSDGYLPILEDLPPRNEDGVGGMHMYMPWWHYKEQKAGKMPFARGYHIEFGGGRGLPEARRFRRLRAHSRRRLWRGAQARAAQDLRRQRRHFAGRGEMIPNADSYCEIDPDAVDQWGIPVLRFHFKWSQDEILQAKHMQETFQEIIDRGGGK